MSAFCVGFSAILAAGCSAMPGAPDDEETLEPSAEAPIIGGSLASAYPESILIDMMVNGRVRSACSGSVIAPKVVLTAGHCVAGFNGWRVRAPFAQNQSATSASAETYDWRDNGSQSVDPNSQDIGLIYLDKAINIPSYPTLATSKVPDGTSVVNIGRINNGTMSNSALYVSKPLTVRDATRYGYPYDYIANEVIESGDSGGPVEIPGANPHRIVAVNSGAGGGTEVLARVDLLANWIAQKIEAHGGGGTTNPDPPDPGQPTTCSGPSEAEPNNTYQQSNALGSSACGKLGSGDTQDWYTWSIGGATNYSVKLSGQTDARLQMWKLVGGSYSAVANTSNTEISHVSSGAGTYVMVVLSDAGATQSYKLTLQK
jgi:hypothetical protein